MVHQILFQFCKISLTPWPLNLTNAAIYLLQLSGNPNHNYFYSMNGQWVSWGRAMGIIIIMLWWVGFDEENQSRANGIMSPGPGGPKRNEKGKDLHMFVWSSSASHVKQGGIHVFRGGADVGAHPKDYDNFGRDEFSFGNKQGPGGTKRERPFFSKLGSS